MSGLWSFVVSSLVWASVSGISIRFPEGPVSVGPLNVEVAFDKAVVEKPIAKVLIEGNMNHAGMVPVFAKLSATAKDTYHGALRLTMAGDWRITAYVTYADGTVDEKSVDLRGVK